MPEKKRKSTRTKTNNTNALVLSTLQSIQQRITYLDSKIDKNNDRITDFRDRLSTKIDTQFENHLSTHVKLDKRVKVWGIILSTGIIGGVVLNNPEAVVKIISSIWKLF